MFKWARQLEISLAAKCQLLFGAAVVLIIAAALAVPFQRMEQLTIQLNERSARTLTDFAVSQHLARPAGTTRPTTRGSVLVQPPTTAPITDVDGFIPPRLILASEDRDASALTPFERKAIHRLRERDREWIASSYETEDGIKGYRFARIDSSCVRCHSGPAATATTLPTTAPATATSKLIGLVSVDISSQIETNQLLLNRVFMLSAGLLAGTLAIVVFYLITTRLILQPVRVLQETAQKVSEGDLNIRSDINTGDEFQQLSETFNQMLTNLKASADQLRAANKSLDLRLGQLAETNSALYESNRLKSEFLANVSHELRTPLNSILGFADLLKDSGLINEPKVSRYIQNILTSGRNLLDLINDLLDLAKIEAGRMDVRSEPLSLTDLFEGLISLLKPLSEKKNLILTSYVAHDVPIIQTDPAKLQQVLYNFMSNAIKFSPQGERIDLKAECEGAEGVRISVTDRGPGISRDKHQIIFEKFRQADASVTREHSGTGLGLAISKELTTLLGGHIGLRSEPGAGSTFWIVLPLKNEASTEDERGKLVLT
ncbi:MAG TPA: ATP-binding protein [Tepidisphaeraceae bacterium]|jgi:signal transduction histidine kinase